MGNAESGIRGSELFTVSELYSHRRSEHAIRTVGMAAALAMADDTARQQAIRSLLLRDDREIHYPAPSPPASENDRAFEALMAAEFPPGDSLQAQFSFPGREDAKIHLAADDEAFETAQDEFNRQEAGRFGVIDGYALNHIESGELSLRKTQHDHDVQRRETVTDLSARLTPDGKVALHKARYWDGETVAEYTSLDDDLIVAAALTRLCGLNQPRAVPDAAPATETTALP